MEPTFFKILLGDYHSQMRIPPAFARQFGFNPKKYFLDGPRSSIKVRAEKKSDGDWYFAGEWARFAEEHSLSDGEVLLFQFAGKDTFHVRVYGRNCCEKSVPSKQNGNSVNTAQKEGISADAAAAKFAKESKHPAFYKVLTESYAERGYLNIPADFYKDYMEGKVENEEDVSVEVSGKVWEVRLTIPPGRTGRFTSGWSKFKRNNLLKVGDACVFELIDDAQDQQLLLKVKCFRCNYPRLGFFNVT